jgi:glycosyltransferase involved in cell wall biosynthesis
MDRIKRTVEELHLSDVVSLPGYVASTDEWYQQFDIFVSSSIREGQPVALLEGMAHGLPALVTDVGACAETVQNGVGGVVVPPGDSRALADGLASLLDDADLRDSLGRNARARVEREYSVTAVAKYHLDCYHELLSNVRAA